MIDYTLHFLFYGGILLYTLATIVVIQYIKSGNPKFAITIRVLASLAILTNLIMFVRIGGNKQAFPLTNLFEALVFTENMLMLAALGIDIVRKIPFLTIATVPVVLAGLLSSAVLLSHSTGKPLEQKSILIDAHIAATLVSYAAFGLAFISAILYIFEQRELKTKTNAYLGFLPSLEIIYRINIRSILVGFVLLTAGLLIGYLEARKLFQGQSDKWRTDPKVILTSMTWLIYLGILIANLNPRIKGKKVAIASVVSFVFVMLTFLATLFWQDFHNFK